MSFQFSDARTAQSSRSDASIPIPVPSQPYHFVDPAIVSVGRKPTASVQQISNVPPQNSASILSEAPSTPLKMISPQSLEALPREHISPSADAPAATAAKVQRPRAPPNKKTSRNTAATLTAPFSGLDISAAAGERLDETDDAPPAASGRRISVNTTRTGELMDDPPQTTENKRPKQRARKKKEVKQAARSLSVDGLQTSPDVTRRGTSNGTYRGKGWRQTPILQDSTNASPKTQGSVAGKAGHEEASSARRNRRQQRAMDLEALNGWATEDATDIQELPDFDFEANLSKFDKRSVFEQIRTDDHTAKESRLVSINRLPQTRPGTYGGKNLHPTENVLDSPRTCARQSSLYLSSDSDEAFSLLDGGRSSSRQRTASRTSTKRLPTRSNSSHQQVDDTVSNTQHPRSAHPFHRPQNHTSANASPLPSTRFTPPDSPRLPKHAAPQPHFRLFPSNVACPTTTPAAMAAIEEVAETDFALPANTITENAGRGIADVTLAALNPGGRRLASENLRLNGRPVVLFLVGNHRVGARALVGARHMRNRGVRVVVFVFGGEREWEGEVKREVDVLVRLGVVVAGWPGDGRENLLGRLQEKGQPEVVVEAILGPGKGYERLSGEEQRAVREMVGWINAGSGGIVVSVDCPSGVNGSTGELVSLVSTADSSSVDPLEDAALEVKAKHIVCVGAPRTGLLRALQKVWTGVTGYPVNALDWQIWAVDIGVNRAWKQCGIAGGPEGGVKFGPDWVVAVRFFDGSDGSGR